MQILECAPLILLLMCKFFNEWGLEVWKKQDNKWKLWIAGWNDIPM